MTAIRIILAVIFLILSAIFSGTEIVYSKVNKLRLQREAESGDKKSKKALELANDFDKTITSILISNDLVNIAMSSVTTVLAIVLFQEKITSGEISESVLTTITSIIVTVIVLIFGEILPKTIFPHFSYTLSRKLTTFINFLVTIFYPIIFVVQKIVDVLAKPFIKDADVIDEDVDIEEQTEKELFAMTEDLLETGEIDEGDKELIDEAIDFADTTAKEILVPRVDVVAFDIEDGIEKMIEDPSFFNNSRVPVYKETIDNIVGIIDTTLVLRKLLNKQSIELKDVLFEPLFVHMTMPISNVLKELKKTHKHIAIVLDEWGGVMGIITMEDILEEIFGEIWDETDVVEDEYIEIDDEDYIIDGDMNINDFFDLVEYDDTDFESEYTTVGGWCTEVLNKFPEPGDKFDFENLNLYVVSVDGIRVEKVKVHINDVEEDEN